MLGRYERERIILEKRSARSRFQPTAVQCPRRKSILEVVSCVASLSRQLRQIKNNSNPGQVENRFHSGKGTVSPSIEGPWK
ncbi:hypothetical protein AVEN_271021-1 [Araneus ventricosus]|uniref:Uncharacterized protein n=1 Tax=Araneus ventricosus TaxID=182803 RepID=A0A4Y2VT43_ARAVE|nr:hypothetical protein AVEN_271021-1 [Araneus ventricosus]